MSLDLYAREVSQELSRLDGTKTLEPSAFDGFLRGTSIFAMKGLAKTARAIDMAGAPIAMAADAFTGGTEAQDRYFKEHDEVLNSAVDFWTPKPLEVGVAAEIAGGLIGQLPTIIASPHLAVGAQVLDTAEDLARQNVPAGKAVAAGVAQGAGLATGIWMPILGQNAFQRMVIGGAGFNMLQGAATRGITGMILEGTPAAEEFKAFDGKALTLDALLGFAFGGVAHLSPAQRAHGAEAMERIKTWAQNLSPSEVAALATLRTAQHLNEDSAPGKPAEPKDVEAHVERMRTAIDQLAKDKPVEVSDLPAPDSTPDNARFTAAARRAEQLEKVGERVRKEEGIEEPPKPVEKAAAFEPPVQPKTKIVDEKGEPLTVYHGGPAGITEFKGKFRNPPELTEQQTKYDVTGRDGDNAPIYFTPSRDAAIDIGRRMAGRHGLGKDEPEIYERQLDVRNPKIVTSADVRAEDIPVAYLTEKLIAKWQREGHDGLVVSEDRSMKNAQEIVVFSPKQIRKSGELTNETEAPAGQPRGAEPPPPRGPSGEKPAGAEAKNVVFRTAKGSEYVVHEDGTTTRNKAARPEHPGDSGPQPRSESTVYVTPENADKLGEFQAQGGAGARAIAMDEEQGLIGVRYESGKDAGKLERRTVVPFESEPRDGLIPVERWNGGKRVHFGNEIAEVSERKESAVAPVAKARAETEATKAPDPLAVEAERIAAERPDMRMVVGLDAEGKPITKSAKEFLDDARGAAKAVEADQDLLRAAASCLLGIA